jgi:hypothetical protein
LLLLLLVVVCEQQSHLHQGGPQGLPSGPVNAAVHNLFCLHLIGHKALGAQPSLAVAGAGKVTGATGHQSQRQHTTKDRHLQQQQQEPCSSSSSSSRCVEKTKVTAKLRKCTASTARFDQLTN